MYSSVTLEIPPWCSSRCSKVVSRPTNSLMNPTSIRVMSLADCDAVARLFDELDVLHSDSLPSLFRHPTRSPRDRAFLESLLETGQSAVLIADVGEVVGFVHVVLRTSPSFPIFVQQARGL